MTSGKEDYLKAIYLISESHELVTNKELSNMLHVSPPSVSEMITKLQKQGYVDYTAYKGSKMTRKGRREAGRLLRYHSLWEVFLVEKLDFSWRHMKSQRVWNTRRRNHCLKDWTISWIIRFTHRAVIRSRERTAAVPALRTAS